MLERSFPDRMDFQITFRDLCNFTYLMQLENIRTQGRVYRNGDFGTAYMFPLLHTIISLPRLGLDQVGSDYLIIECCRLGMILYLAEMRRLFGISGVDSTRQTQKLRYFLQESSSDWGSLGMLKTWCLAMGGMESMGLERCWYFSDLKRVGACLGLNTWDEIERELREILWYDDAHTSSFRDWVKEGEDQRAYN